MISLSESVPALKNQCGALLIIPAVAASTFFGGSATGAIGPTNQREKFAAVSAGDVTVKDIMGRPLGDVSVMIQPRPMILLPENISETTATVTDKSGTFKQPEPEVGATYWVLRKPGYEALALDASRPIRSQVTLRPGRTITGYVLDSSGQPISGALVGPVDYPPLQRCLEHWEHRNPLARQMTRTGADGLFKLYHIPLEPVGVQLSAPGYTPRQAIFAANETGTKLVLNTGGAVVTGEVIGSKDRALQQRTPIEAKGNNVVLYTITDDKGTYTFDNLPTGTWTLRPAGGGPLSGTQSRAAVLDVGLPTDVKNVPLVLNQGTLIAGRAIDAKTSLGLAGINITLSGYAGRGDHAVLTDEDGAFAFENLDSMQNVVLRFDPLQFVYLLPGGAYRDYFDLSQIGDTDFDMTTLTLPLHRRLPVTGKVSTADGKPAADVEVRLQSQDVISTAPSKGGPTPMEFFAYTNGAGGFRTGVYPPGRYKVWAQQESLVSQVQEIAAYTTAPAAKLDLRLDQAAQLEGLVTDAHDAPVTGAVVIAWPSNFPEPEENPIPGRENYRFTKTGAGGAFILKELRGEPMMLRATHPSFVQAVRLPLDPAALEGGTSNGVVLKFPAGGEFAVTVTDDAGRPLSQAAVQLDYAEGLEGHRATVMTDPYGRAFVAALPVQRLEKLAVNHPAFASYKSEGAVALPQMDYKVSLQKRGSLVATVSGDSPVPGVPVEVFLLHAPGGRANSAPPKDGFEQTGRTSVVAGKALFSNLPEGWYKAAYADSGAYAESETVHMEAGGGDKAVELKLPQGSHLTGLVTDKTSGEGIPGANITLIPAVDSDFVAERALQNTTTGDGGTFELYNVGAGRLHVKAIAAGYPEYERDVTFEPGQPLVIEMSNAPAAVSGRVTVGGAPVKGALLILTKSGPAQTPVATAISDAGGAYSMDGFSAGSYTMAVEAPIGEGDNISRKSLPVQIEDDQATQDVEFASLVKVQGSVRLAGNIPRRGNGEPITVLFTGASDGADSKMVRLLEDGSYTTQLEPGPYMVSLEDREGQPVEVPAGEAYQLDLKF